MVKQQQSRLIAFEKERRQKALMKRAEAGMSDKSRIKHVIESF